MPDDGVYLKRNPSRGSGADNFHLPKAEETWRYWIDGDTYPRIILDVPNGAVLVGPGTIPPTPLGGGGGGAPINASYVTMATESGLSNETVLSTIIRADVIANRGAFGKAGQLFFSLDTLIGYLDTGAAWLAILPVLDGGGKVSTAVLPFTLPAGAIVGTTDAQILTNKRIVRRVQALADAATVTPDADNFDVGRLTSLSQPSTFANPTGTPTDLQQYQIRVRSAAPQALSHGTKYRGGQVALPTTTTGGNLTDYFAYEYNLAADTWDCLARSVGY